MDLRNNLFGKPAPRAGAPGLPGRQVQRPAGGDPGQYSPAPAGYDGYSGRSPAPTPRQQGPPGGGYGGDGYGGGNYGGASYGGGRPDGPGSYPPQSSGRQVRLRVAKVEDKTIQAQYIFGNM